MKFRATKKEMKAGYHTIIGIGYCNAQYLLEYEEPIAYSTGAEGWACDYYDINGVLISTGYSYLESKRAAKYNYDTVKKYEDMARDNVCTNISYTERVTKNRELLEQFIKEVTA